MSSFAFASAASGGARRKSKRQASKNQPKRKFELEGEEESTHSSPQPLKQRRVPFRPSDRSSGVLGSSMGGGTSSSLSSSSNGSSTTPSLSSSSIGSSSSTHASGLHTPLVSKRRTSRQTPRSSKRTTATPKSSAKKATSVTIAEEYIASDKLESMENPSKELRLALRYASHEDWSKQFKAINNFRRLAVHHGDALSAEDITHICETLESTVVSLRSSIVKISLLCYQDVCTQLGEHVAVDRVLPPLLMRAINDKRFIRDEAMKAMNSLVTGYPSVEALQALVHESEHNNSKVVACVAQLMQDCLSVLPQRRNAHVVDTLQAQEEFVHSLVLCLATLVCGKESVTRTAGKRALLHLDGMWDAVRGSIEQQSLQAYAGLYVKPDSMQKIKMALRSSSKSASGGAKVGSSARKSKTPSSSSSLRETIRKSRRAAQAGGSQKKVFGGLSTGALRVLPKSKQPSAQAQQENRNNDVAVEIRSGPNKAKAFLSTNGMDAENAAENNAMALEETVGRLMSSDKPATKLAFGEDDPLSVEDDGEQDGGHQKQQQQQSEEEQEQEDEVSQPVHSAGGMMLVL